MAITNELRLQIAADLSRNRKFDGDTDIPEEVRAFADLSTMEVIKRPAVDGFPYTIYLYTAKNKHPNSPLHINVHGGGFVVGHMPNDHLWSAWLASQIHGVVVDVDYTTTDLAPHPVGMDQCRDAARFAKENCEAWGCDPKRISMGGYSAGGTYTVGCGMAAIKNHEVDYALLINGYGPADMRYDPKLMETPEYWKIPQNRGDSFSVLLSDGDASVMERPELYPLGASDEDLKGMPRMLIISAETCTFRFQNDQLGVRLSSLGTEVLMKRFPDTKHGFIPHFSPHWDEAGELIVRTILNSSL